MTICAMLKSRSVVLPELAVHLNDAVKTDSNQTRLRDFFRETTFDYEAIAVFICLFLQQQPNQKIRLTLDRTKRFAAAAGIWLNFRQYIDDYSE